MDVLTNEGRSWYQGVRFSAIHRTTPLVLTASYTRAKGEDRLNHWFSPENSRDPESDRGPTGADTPHNLVTSISWNVPGSGPVLSGWRLSTVSHHQSGSPYTIRYAARPGRLQRRSERRLQLTRLPAEHARRPQHGPRDVHQLRRPHARAPVRRLAATTSRFARTCSTSSTTRTCWRAATSTSSATRGSASTTGGSERLPGRQFQFAATYRF